jgi:hypothetical protein
MKTILKQFYYTGLISLLFFPLTSLADGETIASLTLDNPLGDTTTFSDLITKILDVVITITTPIAVLFMIYAGFLFVIARGNPEAIKKAKTVLMWTIVGVMVLLGSKVIMAVITGTITQL